MPGFYSFMSRQLDRSRAFSLKYKLGKRRAGVHRKLEISADSRLTPPKRRPLARFEDIPVIYSCAIFGTGRGENAIEDC
jgi:hypothetical protein